MSMTLVASLLGACGGSSTSSSNANTVKEFVSLEQKANFEYGYVEIDDKKTELSYVAPLLYNEKVDDKPVYYGFIGAFSETQNGQIIAISSKDGQQPTNELLFVNIPDIPNGYKCDKIDYDQRDSNVIKDYKITIITATNCQGKGSNAGKTKNIKVKLSSSMFVAGSSRINVQGKNAYLETDYRLNKHLSVGGGLGTRAYNQIFDLHLNHPEVTTIVEKRISGSLHDDINMQTGRLIRKYGLNTHLTSTSDIASGGVDLFCSGKKRSKEPGAKLGVHSWSSEDVANASDLPESSPLHQNQIDYFTEMLGTPTGKEFYFYTINAAPANQIHQMNEAEIAEYHLLTE